MHLGHSTNSEVQALKIDGHALTIFPSSIEKTFNNLLAIYINDGELVQITQSDMKVFPLLRYLDLFGNKIETIDGDLFKFNPNLSGEFLNQFFFGILVINLVCIIYSYLAK